MQHCRKDVSEIKSYPADTKLTVYSNTAHIIQQFPPGSKSVTLPSLVDVSSIFAIGVDGMIIPFTYSPEVGIRANLTNRLTGERITVRVRQGDDVMEGKLLSYSEDRVTLLCKGEILVIRDYDAICASTSQSGTTDLGMEYGMPTVSFDDVPTIFTISYLTSGITWQCVGTALINPDTEVIQLRLAGTIDNQTEVDINANVTLVTGDVFQKPMRADYESKAMSSMVRAKAKLIMPAEEDVEINPLQDFMKYNLGFRHVNSRSVAEMAVMTINSEKIYIHFTNSKTTSYGFKFVAPDYIPPCTVNVYSTPSGCDCDGMMIDSYLGSSNLKECQPGDKEKILIGLSSLVKCESDIIRSTEKISGVLESDEGNPNVLYTVQDADRVKNIRVTEDLTTVITNKSDKNAKVIIKHYVGSNPILDLERHVGARRVKDWLLWELIVEAKSETTLKAKIQTLANNVY
jgi:hypothetical protein